MMPKDTALSFECASEKTASRNESTNILRKGMRQRRGPERRELTIPGDDAGTRDPGRTAWRQFRCGRSPPLIAFITQRRFPQMPLPHGRCRFLEPQAPSIGGCLVTASPWRNPESRTGQERLSSSRSLFHRPAAQRSHRQSVRVNCRDGVVRRRQIWSRIVVCLDLEEKSC